MKNRENVRITLTLFAFLSSLYVITSAGHFTTSMDISVYKTAMNVVEEGDFALEKPTLETGIGRDGRYYTYEGLAFVLIVTVFFVFSKIVGISTGLLVIITNQILTPLACIVLFFIGRELKYSIKTSIIISLLYGVGTMAWVHSRFLMPEPFTTVVYLTAFLFLVKYKNMKKGKWLFLCGCFTGLALIVRPDAPLFISGIVIGVLVLFLDNYKKGNKDLRAIIKESLIFLAPLIVFFALYSLYNYVRFGDFLEMGYSSKRQQLTGSKGYDVKGISETLQGLAGMWVIPCRSVFFINPVLVFIFWAVKDFWKKFRFELMVIGGIFILHVILYSNRGPAGFPGSSAWGVRYMVPMTSFMVIVMGIFIEKVVGHKRRLLWIFVAVFTISAIFQFIGSSENYQIIQSYLEKEYNTPDDKWVARRMMTMDPKWNLITQNIKLLQRGHTDFMYYNYFRGGTVPDWVSLSLFILILTGLASIYLLLKLLFLPVQEQARREKLRVKKKKRRKTM